MREWDRNKDGEVSKQEFKASIRASLHLKAEAKEIEKLFDSLDVDGGGTLDLKEVSSALRQLLDAARLASVEDGDVRTKGEKASKRASEVLAALHATAAVEREEAKYEELKAKPAVDALLGDALMQRCNREEDTTIEMIGLGWRPVDEEGHHVGEIDKAAFTKHALELLCGESPSEEVRAQLEGLFDQLMIYQAVTEERLMCNTLDVKQLERMPTVSDERKEEIARQGTLCYSLRKAAAKLQAAIS